jgi:hypothetical protein
VDRDAQLPVLLPQRQDQVLLHQLVGDRVHRPRRHRALVEVDVFHVVLCRQRLEDVVLAAQLEVEQ